MKKTLVGLLAVLLCATACTTSTPNPGDPGVPSGQIGFNCETAQKAYALYQASLAFRIPSPDEIAAAKAAAAFLTVACGWSTPTTSADGAREMNPPKNDKYGVPVIAPK